MNETKMNGRVVKDELRIRNAAAAAIKHFCRCSSNDGKHFSLSSLIFLSICILPSPASNWESSRAVTTTTTTTTTTETTFYLSLN